MTDTLARGQVVRTAVLSACGTYRYELRRQWGPAPLCAWVLLNPSTADAEVDDPTIRRCVGFARSWGAGGIVVVNLFALRSRDPAQLGRHADPVGPLNESSWQQAAAAAPVVVCAWGAHPMAKAAAPALLVALQARGADVRCLGTTKSDAPRHPLYVRADAPLRPLAYEAVNRNG